MPCIEVAGRHDRKLMASGSEPEDGIPDGLTIHGDSGAWRQRAADRELGGIVLDHLRRLGGHVWQTLAAGRGVGARRSSSHPPNKRSSATATGAKRDQSRPFQVKVTGTCDGAGAGSAAAADASTAATGESPAGLDAGPAMASTTDLRTIVFPRS